MFVDLRVPILLRWSRSRFSAMSGHRGGILELVSRGKKDVFFTANPKVSFFHSVYVKAAPFTEEVYVMAPRNVPEWGKWTEFTFEHRGDLVRKIYLRIQLPTWLSDSLTDINRRSLVTDASGVSYGYCNNVGFQVIDKIQFFQEQLLVQEIYGEYLDWRLRQTNSLATTLVIAGSVGARGESTADVGRAATPGMLRIPIPMVGWEAVGDPGFPMVAMKNQRFRVRVLLRNYQDVIVASDGRLRPSPWDIPLRVQTTRGGAIDTTQRSRSLADFQRQRVDVMLETTQVYVPPDIQEWLRIQEWSLPFRHIQHQSFTIQDNQMHAAAVNAAGLSLSFRLDFTGAASRILAGFQRVGDRQAGQRTFLLKDAATELRINVSGQDRVQPFPLDVFRDFTSYWRNMRAAQDLSDLSAAHDVYTFTFGGFDTSQPYGTLNFTRAIQPDLWVLFGPIPIDWRTRSRQIVLSTYVETFNIWEIHAEKGLVLLND